MIPAKKNTNSKTGELPAMPHSEIFCQRSVLIDLVVLQTTWPCSLKKF
jgi:hypothetical protein